MDAFELLKSDHQKVKGLFDQVLSGNSADNSIVQQIRRELLVHAQLEEMMGDIRPGAISSPGRYRVRCELPPVLTPGDYVITVWFGSAYENLELHEDVVGFAVEGDDLGRVRRLVKLGTDWQVARVDDP